VTHLRKLMLDELQRRNCAQNTVRAYIHAIEDFAKYFHRSPDRLGPEHIRVYQVHLLRDCKLSPETIEGRTAALRFLLVKTLRRPYLPDHIPFPKRQRRMPTVLSQEEVTRLESRTAESRRFPKRSWQVQEAMCQSDCARTRDNRQGEVRWAVRNKESYDVLGLSLSFTPRNHQRDVILLFAAGELLDSRYDRLQKRLHR
jgi:hypothetical protein